MLKQSLILAAKDTRVFLKDWFGLAFALLFPLVFVLGFSLALRNVGPGDERLSITVVTQEEEGISRQIIEGLAEENVVDLTVMEYGTALRATEDGDIGGFVAFPEDFTSSLVAGRPTKLEVVARIGDPETEAALSGFANAVAAASSNTRTAVQAILQLGGAEALPLDMGAFGRDRALLRFETEQIGPVEAYNAGNFTVPGYLTMFVFFAAALAAEAITRERENHTMERLTATGTRRGSVVAGKYLGSVYRGVMQLAVLWGVGLVAFRIDLGFSPAAVILISVLMVLTSAAFGVMLAALVRTQASANSAAVLASLVLAPIGGCWWPLFITPEWMQTLALITPHGWANSAFNKLMLFGAEGGDVVLELAALAAFGVGFLVIALVRFRLSPRAS
ncbi:MAG: ABC transporter permease [bacterium]|nr:ABC transporter permease [bacterium]MDE0287698.1 ABC transporter permease [bacterium]MDE0438210.1 ABC transporter permease [bacterium]